MINKTYTNADIATAYAAAIVALNRFPGDVLMVRAQNLLEDLLYNIGKEEEEKAEREAKENGKA